jgi:hypothetical protein
MSAFDCLSSSDADEMGISSAHLSLCKKGMPVNKTSNYYHLNYDALSSSINVMGQARQLADGLQ